MTSKIDDLFAGWEIILEIPASSHSPAQSEAIRKTIAAEKPRKLRFNCVVAEAMNESLNGGAHGTPSQDYGDYTIGGRAFRLNPSGRSQFGMDFYGKPFLTTSLVDVESGTRYKLTWRGEHVPRTLQRTAVDHDEGINTPALVEHLSFDHAEKYIVGQKNGQPPAHDPRRNHDTAKNGHPYVRGPRRDHKRICRKDLVGN